MAKGIACPMCKSLLEGDYQIGETTKCPACNAQFDISYDDFQRYQVVNQRQKVKEISRQNESKIKKLGRILLRIVITLILIYVGLRACFWLAEGSGSSSSYDANVAQNTPVSVPAAQTTAQVRQKLASGVAADKIAEYEMAKASGDKMKACVLAGIIKQAFLTANDQEHYRIWMGVEKSRCAEAGVPIN